jgi:serine/threonine protein kinase
VHRDIKPENMLIDSNGNLKLTDFGISAKITSLKKAKSIIGTSNYMAPEVFLNGESGYDESTDVWALGCCMYEIVVGNPPFGKATSSKNKMR